MPSSIISPFPVFNDLDGSPLENGYIYIGQSNLNPETAPVNVFWDAARTIPAAQPIRTIGGFPSRNGSPSNVYVEADTYSITVRNSRRVFVYSAFDQSDAPSSVFDISTQVITATAGQTTFTLTTFTYLPGTDTLQVYRNGLRLTSVTDYIETNSSTVTLTSPAALGDEFLFQGGAVITGNQTPGTAVSFIQAGTGAVTRNMQDKARESVSVFDFGAVGNGVTDDTDEIQAALNSVPFGGNVQLPSGTYKISSLTIPDGVRLVGQNPYGSVLVTTSATGNVLALGVSSGIQSLKVASSVARTSGAHVSILKNGSVVLDCEFGNYYIGINVGSVVGAELPVGVQLESLRFRDANVVSGGGAINADNFSSLVIKDVIASYDSPGNQPDFGIKVNNGDTLFMDSVNITLHGTALNISPAASLNCYAFMAVNCAFDSARNNSSGTAVSSAVITPAGGVYDTQFVNCWFGLSQAKFGCFVEAIGGGAVDGLDFGNCQFVDNGDSGLLVNGTACKNITVTGGHSSSNTDAGLRFNNSTDFTITGHRAGNVATRGPNNYGIKIGGTCDTFQVTGNDVTGNTTGGLIDTASGTTMCLVAANTGYNFQALAGETVGASPWTFTNGHTQTTLYVLGGTVSDIKQSGQTIQNTTGATVCLAPNETMQITYSSLPTVLKKVM